MNILIYIHTNNQINIGIQTIKRSYTIAIVYSCFSEFIVLRRMTTIPPPSTVSTVRATRLGVRASKSYNRKWESAHSREHTQTHTPGAVGSHLCCGTQGAVRGLVPCSRTLQSWYWRWREFCTFTPPPTIPAGSETRTRNLWVTSPTLKPLGHDCP